MSSLEIILTRMMNDTTFADAVFTDASKALAEYKLSNEELAKFKAMSRAEFEALSTDDRKSFGWGNHNQTFLSIHS